MLSIDTTKELNNYHSLSDHQFKTPEDNFLRDDKYMLITDRHLDQLIDEKVENKIKEILERRKSFRFRKVNNTVAHKEMAMFLKEKHRKNIFKISILDIVLQLKLPPEQVEKVMDYFEKRGKAREII